MQSENDISSQLSSLVQHLRIARAAFNKVVPIIAEYIIRNSPSLTGGAQLQDAQCKQFTMVVYNCCKGTYRYFVKSQFVPYIPFLLNSIFSADYTKNPKLTIDFILTDIKWTNIPVSNFEILLWWDMVVGFIDRLGMMKYTLDLWYKYWILSTVQIDGLSKILTFMIDHIEDILSKNDKKTANIQSK